MNNFKTVNENNINNIGIYKIVTPSSKVYIGMTNDSFKSRWANHLKDLKRGVHKCTGLQNSYNKYGWEKLDKIIIEEYPKNNSINNKALMAKYLYKRELRVWVEYKNNNYSLLNGEPTGTGSIKHSDYSKEKISNSLTRIFFDDDKLKEMYKDKNNTLEIIADYFNCSKYTVMKRLKKLEVYNGGRAKEKSDGDNIKILNYDLYDLYFKQNLSFLKISKIINVDDRKIQNIIMNDYSEEYFLKNSEIIEKKKKAGLKTAHAYHLNKKIFTDFCEYCIDYCEQNNIDYLITRKQLLYELNNNLTKVQISKKYNISNGTLNKLVKKLMNSDSLL